MESESFSPFGQDLKGVPLRFRHNIFNSADVLGRDLIVEQITHGIHEDALS